MARDDGRKPFLRRPTIVALAAVGLLMIAAASTPEGWAFLDAQSPQRIIVPDPPAVFGYALMFIAIATTIFAIWMRARSMREGVTKRRKSSPLSTILIMALLVGLWATSPRLQEWLQDRFGGDDREAAQAQDPDADPEPAPRSEPSAAFGFAITLVLFLLLAAATVAGLWLFRREQPEDAEEDITPELLEEIQRGIDDLTVISDPRAAVIACYARMEAASAASGVEPRPADTPFEHLARLLERHRVAEGSARRLTELFERAKFSSETIDEVTRREALEALGDVRAQLGTLV